MKSAARPIWNVLKSQRGFAAQAQAASRAEGGAVAKQEPKISRLPNGAIVASLENYSPVSKVAIAFNAGSKAETGDNSGVTHCIRNAANMTTSNVSSLAITRSVEQLGGSLTCSTTRDHVFYQMEVLRDGLAEGFDTLSAVATSNEFRSWELGDTVKRTKLDLAILSQTPEAQMTEALHAAAYRSGLGNSLYMGEHLVGTHTSEMLQAFVNQNHTSSNMAVVGLGVDHGVLVNLVKNGMATGAGQGPAVPASKYFGGEQRIRTLSPLVHAAVVTEGVGLGSKDLMALGVLQHIMGGGPSIKYSANLATSKVNQAAAAATSGPFSASCINMNYAESGLFGFHAVAHKNDIGAVLKALTGQFSAITKGGINDADVKRGKAQLKAAIHMTGESSSTALQDITAGVLLSEQVLQAQDIDAAIEKVTTAEVQALAKKVINGKPSMAAVGDLGATPYLDQILV